MCGRCFWRFASQKRLRGATWCSRACQAVGQRKHPQRTCARCGKRFWPPNGKATGRGQFCSRRCYDDDRRYARIELVCAECGAKFTRAQAFHRKTRGAKSFCSRTCSVKHQAGANHHAHRGRRLPRRGKAWAARRIEVLERDGYRCVRCPTEGTSATLDVDHIVPARLFATDEEADRHENLATLCTPCHAVKTHRIEPRVLKGEMIALVEFYGAGRAMLAVALEWEPQR